MDAIYSSIRSRALIEITANTAWALTELWRPKAAAGV